MGISRKKIAACFSDWSCVLWSFMNNALRPRTTTTTNNNNKNHLIPLNGHCLCQSFNSFKWALTLSGAAILFCLVTMQHSVSDSESAPNTVMKRHKAFFGNVLLHSGATKRSVRLTLCNSSRVKFNKLASGHLGHRCLGWAFWPKRIYQVLIKLVLRLIIDNVLKKRPIHWQVLIMLCKHIIATRVLTRVLKIGVWDSPFIKSRSQPKLGRLGGLGYDRVG